MVLVFLDIRIPNGSVIPFKAEFNRNHGGGHTGHAPKEDFYDPEIWKIKALENAKRWKGLYVRYLKARISTT